MILIIFSKYFSKYCLLTPRAGWCFHLKTNVSLTEGKDCHSSHSVDNTYNFFS